MIMDIIIFEISGKFAHFRKFYTNSSSLSYSVPSRTTVEGIIAAILGLERDTYYEKLSLDNCKIAIEKVNKTRKINQSLNYIKVKSSNDFKKIKNHTQIPIEIIASEKKVKYRIYISHTDEEIMEELEERLKSETPIYPIFLGAANYIAKTQFIDRIKIEEQKSIDFIGIKTIININHIKDLKIDFKKQRLVKEKMPIDFLKGRNPKKAQSFIYDENCNEIFIITEKEYYNYNGKNILFI
jgi:CRISPR-associated protein Cas5h